MEAHADTQGNITKSGARWQEFQQNSARNADDVKHQAEDIAEERSV
jgi:hypothetical protein